MNKIIQLGIILLLMNVGNGYSCKEAKLNESFPIKSFERYSDIIIARVNEVRRKEKTPFGRLLSFDVTVKDSFKGKLKHGDTITIKPAIEQARAVCQVYVSKNAQYLMLLNRDGKAYTISRFSFPTDSNHKYYTRYVDEIKQNL